MNKFSQPIQTSFVPTYAPVNIDAIAQSAQAMQTRQDNNLAQRDSLYGQVYDALDEVGSADQVIAKDFLTDVEKQLAQYDNEGDWFRAGKDVKKLALDTQKFLNSGDWLKAKRHLQTKTANIKAIREMEGAPITVKKGLEQMQYEQDQGVRAGTKINPIMLPDKWEDYDTKVLDWIDEMEPKTWEQYGLHQQERYVQDPNNPDKQIRTVDYFDAKTKRKMRPAQAIYSVLSERLDNDLKFKEQAIIEAKALGLDPEKHLEAKKKQLLNSAVENKTINDLSLSNVDTGNSGENTSDPYINKYTLGAGVGFKSVYPDNVNDFYSTFKEAYDYRELEPEIWEAKKTSFNTLLASMVSHGKITPKQMNKYKSELERNNYQIENIPTSEYIRDQTIFNYDPDTQIGGENKALKELHEKTQAFIDENPAFAPHTVTLEDKGDRDALRDMLAKNVDVRNFKVINTEDNPEEQKVSLNNIKKNLESPSANIQMAYQNDGRVYFQVGWEEGEGEDIEAKEYLIEQTIQSPEQYGRTVTEAAADMIGGREGEKIKNGFRLRNMDWYADGNLLEKLPRAYRPSSIDDLRIEPAESSEGIMARVKYEGDSESVYLNNFDFYKSTADALKGSTDPKAFQKWHNFVQELDRRTDNGLTQDQKSWMLQNMDIPSEVADADYMNNPYTFNSPIELTTFLQ